MGILINNIQALKKGYTINIKKSHKGKFTDYCGGKITDKCIEEGKSHCGKEGLRDKEICKMATFAENARGFNHGKMKGKRDGGILLRGYQSGGKSSDKREEGEVSMETLHNIMRIYHVPVEDFPRVMEQSFNLIQKMRDSGHLDFNKVKSEPETFFAEPYMSVVSTEDKKNPYALMLVKAVDMARDQQVLSDTGHLKLVPDETLALYTFGYAGKIDQKPASKSYNDVIEKNMNKIMAVLNTPMPKIVTFPSDNTRYVHVYPKLILKKNTPIGNIDTSNNGSSISKIEYGF